MRQNREYTRLDTKEEWGTPLTVFNTIITTGGDGCVNFGYINHFTTDCIELKSIILYFLKK